MEIDLAKEQRATQARPRCRYSLVARWFFAAMDLMTGRRTTLGKAKLIEMLASIPYRSWEIRQYTRLTRCYRNQELVTAATRFMRWGREAQDNEYSHLLVIHEKMREDGMRDPWYLRGPIPFLMVAGYVVLTRVMAVIAIRSALRFNAEFEDHAEHVYAQFVADNPQWEKQVVMSDKVRAYAPLNSWADVFRRVSLDERDHMNISLLLCGKEDSVVRYDGMPDISQYRQSP